MKKIDHEALKRIKEFEPLKGLTPELESRTVPPRNKRLHFFNPPVRIATTHVDKHTEEDKSPTSELRGERIKTYMISMPIDAEEPNIKGGFMKQIVKTDTLADIAEHIEDVEKMASNIQIIHVECSNCVATFKNMFNKCRLKSKVKATVV